MALYRHTLFVALLALVSTSAWGDGRNQQQLDRQWQQTPFGERGVYQLESQFSYISAWGPTAIHDVESTTNSGSISLVDGFIEVQSGTTADSTADLETVKRVVYESGRQLEAAIKIGVKDAPEDGAVAEWGLGTDSNGAYFRLDDGTLSVVYESSGQETVIPRNRMRGDEGDCAQFNAVDDPAVYVVRFNWYGAGGASYWAYHPSSSDVTTLSECLLHWHAPSSDSESWPNPNLPIFARVDNTNSTTDDDVNITVGGRRAGTQGGSAINFRPAGDYRAGQSVLAADGLVPTICIRRDSAFPTASQLNSVPLKIVGFNLETNNNTFVYFVVDPDLSGASFGTPTHAVAAEIAIEVDTSATGLSNPKHVSGPFLVTNSGNNKTGDSGLENDLSVPFIAEQPTCMAVDVVADSTVTSTLRVNEGW